MASADLTVLTHGRWRAQIDARLGGSLLELSHAGAPVLRPTEAEAVTALGVRAAAGFPLLPYANRIADARLPVGGRIYPLRPNFPPEPHAVHGIGWQRPWQILRADERSAELSLRYAPDVRADWPFAFAAWQRFELTARGLVLALALQNHDTVAWPAGLGWHPYLRFEPGQTLQFDAAGAWSNGADRLPAQPVSGPAWDFSRPREIAALDLDHDFNGWRGLARIAGSAVGSIVLRASAVFSVLRVFTPVRRGFFAVEPVTHIADAVHRPPSVITGYRQLEPGGTLAGTIAIELEQAG
jgi:aldose 1-epimerase